MSSRAKLCKSSSDIVDLLSRVSQRLCFKKQEDGDGYPGEKAREICVCATYARISRGYEMTTDLNPFYKKTKEIAISPCVLFF